ncbi:MAG: HD domain-containing protein [Thermoprotei archaeon]
MGIEITHEIEAFVQKVLGNDFDHGYPHVVRVRNIAEKIVETLNINVDRKLLNYAILLHDIGRVIGEPHAYYSALIAKSLLLERGFDDDFVNRVANAILYHSYSYSRKYRIKPLTEEAKILSDADKLDALGVVGFLRVFIYNTKKGSKLDDVIKHFHEKILRLPNLMHYEYTRKWAIKLREKTVYLLKELGVELGIKILE